MESLEAGKSKFCLDEITNKSNLENQIYIIVPEQFSYMTEKKLLETCTNNSVINAEVLSFNRMAHRIFLEVGGAIDIKLTEAGRAMLIYTILEKQKKDLKFLGKSNENIELVLRTIAEFKKNNITELNSTIDKIEDQYLKLKLTDINNIYMEYSNIISSRYIDEDDLLTLLYKKIDKSQMFRNAEIYIDEFSGFTKQECQIILKLLKQAKKVTITACTDSLTMCSNLDTDIFYSNKQMAKKLIDYAKKEGIKIEKPIQLDKAYRYKNDELVHLENNIYSILYNKYEKEVQNIKLFLAKNPYTEIENVAQEVINLVQNEDFRFRDISIITKNIDNYAGIAKAVFSKYNIPLFIDQKSSLSQNILIKYVLAILEIYTNNWSLEAVFSYIKTGFLNLEKDDIYILENYCLKWEIKGRKWHANWEIGLNNNEENSKEEQNFIKHINDLRLKVVTPILNLKESFTKSKTAKELTLKLYNFLEENNIKEQLMKKIKYLEANSENKIANEYKKSYDILIDLLDEIVLIFGDTKVTFDRYKEILKTGLNFSSLGNIPESVDEVIIGDIDRSRTHKVRAVFILGINDGIFPSINRSEGFLNDKDRDNLKKVGAEIAKGTLDALYEDQFNIYKAFTTAEEKLFLSYLSSDKDSRALRPSSLIYKLKKVFSKLKETSDVITKKSKITNQDATYSELLLNLRNFKNGEQIDKIWFDVYNWYAQNEKWEAKLKKDLEGLNYSNIPKKIDAEIIEKLYGENLKTSISRLEQYKRCPFSFYLKYGLGIKEREEFNIRPIDFRLIYA